MTAEQARLITKVLVVLTPVVWIGWDAFVYCRFGNDPTESRVLAAWADQVPGFRYLVTAAVFAIVGHTLWSQHLGTGR